MAKNEMRRKCRHVILLQASLFSGRTYRMKNINEAVAVVRRNNLVSRDILLGAGFNSKEY
jgi:hypothetical protein